MTDPKQRDPQPMEDLRTAYFLEEEPPTVSLAGLFFGFVLGAICWLAMLLLVAVVLSDDAFGAEPEQAQHFVSKHGFDISSTAGVVSREQLNTSVDAFIEHSVQHIRHETVWQIVNLAPPAIVFVPRRIKCPTGECDGAFDPPASIVVYLETPNCVAVSSLMHELSHWLLWQTNADNTHRDQRFFIQRDVAGIPLSRPQQAGAVEQAATWSACDAGCPWVGCK